VVADGEHTRRRHDPEQAGFFQIDPALAGLEPAEKSKPARD
jgi:hypothetical protein